MTVVAILLAIVSTAAGILSVLIVVGDADARRKAELVAPYYPSHAAWTKDGATTRLEPGEAITRAGVHRAPGVWLVPELGEDEWRFPPWPGDR